MHDIRLTIYRAEYSKPAHNNLELTGTRALELFLDLF